MKLRSALTILATTSLLTGVALSQTPVTACGTLAGNNQTFVLQNDLIVGGTCFTFTGDNSTLDGNGYSITGNGSGYGVRDETSLGTVVKNLTVDNFDVGIRLYGSTGSTGEILNCTARNCPSEGAYLRGGVKSVRNSVFTDNGSYGIYHDNGADGELTGNTITGSGSYGIRNRGSGILIENNLISGNFLGLFLNLGTASIVRNNDIVGNTARGIGLNNSDGNTIEDNIIIGGGSGIHFDNTLSQNNVFTNNDIMGHSASTSHAGIYNFLSTTTPGNNTFMFNHVDANNGRGVYNRAAPGNHFIGNSFSFNGDYGVFIESSQTSGLTFSGNTVEGNAGGMRLRDSQANSYTNNLIRNNTSWGIQFWGNADGNTLSGNRIEGNSNIGIQMVTGSLRTPDGNVFYNNIINNVTNVQFSGDIGANSWDTAVAAGPNIVGGPSLGGNFWANPSGTGFSETCTDSNADGFCDAPGTLNAANEDALPLVCNLPTCEELQSYFFGLACSAEEVDSLTDLASMVALMESLLDEALKTTYPCTNLADCRAATLAAFTALIP